MHLRSQSYQTAKLRAKCWHLFNSSGHLLVDDEQTLNTCLTILHYSPNAVRNVTTLELKLHACTPPLVKIRQLLRHANSLEVFVLELQDNSSATGKHLLKYLRFARLDFFRTNVSHGGLLDFLKSHADITHLSLGTCRTSSCPLKSLPINHLESVRGPMSCISPFIAGSPIKSASLLDFSLNDAVLSLNTAVTRQQFSGPLITRLHIHFYPGQADLLRTIIRVAPLVSSIKLTEVLPAENLSQARPWDDSVLWAAELCELRRLNRFLIRTSASLVNVSGDHNEEQVLMKAWFGGHRYLKDVTIWYLAGQEDDCLSWWNHDLDGSWYRKLNVVSPDESQFI